MNGKSKTYNERLFSGGGLRSFLHNARFRWARAVLEDSGQSPRRIVEIGCFDGKLVDHLAHPPERYVGLDAGWEGGIKLAQRRFADTPGYTFIVSNTPDGLGIVEGEHFDLGVAMETLEHVPPEQVDGYLKKLSLIVDGSLLVTVPNEKGVVFLAKWLAKKLVYGDAERYSFRELVAATFGNMDKVERSQHKGFDYKELIDEISRYFDVIRVDAIPLRGLPLSLAFGVGILARSRPAVPRIGEK